MSGDRARFGTTISLDNDGDALRPENGFALGGLEIDTATDPRIIRSDGRYGAEEFLREVLALDGSPFDVVIDESSELPQMTVRSRIKVEGEVVSADSHGTDDGFHIWEWSVGGEARPGIELFWSEADESLLRAETIILASLLLVVLAGIAAILVVGFDIRPARRRLD